MMSKNAETITVDYEGFQIAVQLADYRAIVLTDEERAEAETRAATVEGAGVEQTRAYLLQATFMEHMSTLSVFRVPRPLVHERALAMGRTLEQRLEMDQLTLDGYLSAMNTSKEALISDFEIEAKQQLRQRICLLAIAKAEGLGATDAEYAAEIERLSGGYPVSQEELVGLFASSGEDASIKRDIEVSKAANFISTLI